MGKWDATAAAALSAVASCGLLRCLCLHAAHKYLGTHLLACRVPTIPILCYYGFPAGGTRCAGRTPQPRAAGADDQGCLSRVGGGPVRSGAG